MKTKTFYILTAVTLSLGLTACGAKSDSKKSVKGTLVVPLASQKVIAKVLKKASGVHFKEACPNVPAGYKPLKGVKVEFVDSGNKTVEDTKTNDCGEFSASVPEGVVKVKAKSSGNKELITDVSVFQSTGATALASTIPSDAEYQISSIQMTADNKVAFSVTDTVTNNAVIGIPNSALSAKINTNDVGISKLESAANISDPASVTLVMDASGSMQRSVFDKDNKELIDAKGYSINRFRVSHLAAHTYLNNTPKVDETGFIVFSNTVNFLNDETLKTLFPAMKDMNDSPTTYVFSKSGYSKEASKLRLLVDAYNPYSTLYRANGMDDKHKDSPNVKLGRYPWGSSTALFNATREGISRTSKRMNSRKLVIVMSDGINNRSPRSVDTVIDLAKEKAIPVHTIAFGGGSDEKIMKRIANETNASFYKATGIDLVAAFRSIQTSITFQYLANLIDKAKKGDKVTISLNYNGAKVSRTVTR